MKKIFIRNGFPYPSYLIRNRSIRNGFHYPSYLIQKGFLYPSYLIRNGFPYPNYLIRNGFPYPSYLVSIQNSSIKECYPFRQLTKTYEDLVKCRYLINRNPDQTVWNIRNFSCHFYISYPPDVFWTCFLGKQGLKSKSDPKNLFMSRFQGKISCSP